MSNPILPMRVRRFRRHTHHVWCPKCGAPMGSFRWGNNRGKNIVSAHAAPRCTGSFDWGKPLTEAEEAALALRPSLATLRALDALAAGESSARDFAERAYPDADHARVTRVGSRGGYASGMAAVRSAASALARLVKDGLAARRLTDEGGGPLRPLWRITDGGEAVRLLDKLLPPGGGVASGRTAVPSDAEALVHQRANGHWLLARTDGKVDLFTLNVAFVDPALVAFAWPLDAERRPCAWPDAAPP